ncbi:MAG: GTP-binding protein [Candidatus Heimdallarchaeota archaeon]|nr:GTP-binding protein [Candidatus Heimdallarchaeota archaeon]
MAIEEASDYIFKIIAVGDAGVGKSALTIRFAHNSFSDSYAVTLGMNLVSKHIELGQTSVEYTVWDIGGQPNFQTILPMYYRGALGALVVYDLTKKESFDNIVHWIDDIKKYCDEVPLVVIGNKSDLIDERALTEVQGKEMAETLRARWSKDIHFIETSAKQDIGVTQAFMDLAESILKMIKEEEEEED